MSIPLIQSHKYIKLVEFALQNKTFSVEKACEISGLTQQEFQLAKPAFFVMTGRENYTEPFHELCGWQLKPETLFSYISYLEFQYSLENSKKARWFSIISLLVASVSLAFAIYSSLLGGG